MRKATMLGLALLLCTGAAAAGDQEHHAPPAVDDSRFEFLRQLEGNWVGKMSDEMSEGVFEFRLTAGGTAIEEREMIGTPMEMVTLYHMDGSDLVATHYCMLGNQPRLKASRSVVDDTLSFSCSGTPGNAASHDEHHVHGWSIRLDEEGRLHYSAELVEDGRVTEAPTVVLTRQTKTARR